MSWKVKVGCLYLKKFRGSQRTQRGRKKCRGFSLRVLCTFTLRPLRNLKTCIKNPKEVKIAYDF